ncbi:MAG: SprB repeat-containing protein [Lewinellaceae bacterium]|nr:SprB repeat-containing protein [Lewinellaceae bacterium]
MTKKLLLFFGVLAGIGYATHIQAQCTGGMSVMILGSTSGSPLTATASSTPASCNGGSNGTATVVPAGGSPAYSYNWEGSPTGDGTATITGLTMGTYTVTVTDVNLCSTVTSVMVAQPTALTAAIAATDASGVVNDMIVCPGGSANLDANPSGGTPGYTYVWDNMLPAQEMNTVTPPATTTYNVTVTDANSCTAVAAKTITVNPTLTAAIAATDMSGYSSDMIVCPGGSATLDADPNGGTPGYTYVWDNMLAAQEMNTVTPPATTTYNVTVTDANGCTAVAAKTITVNPALSAVIAATDASGVANDMIVCPGGSANLDANPTGGSPGYNYTWDNDLTGNTDMHTVTPVATTTYNVTITDNVGCTTTAAKTITVNPALSAVIAATDASGVANDMIVCPGGSANLDANPTGGTAGYTYAWDNSLPAQEMHTVTPVATTTYNVTVTDVNGCTAVAAKMITVNPALTFSSASVTSNYNGAHVSCAAGQGTSNNGEITVAATGGTPGYMYSKDNGMNYQMSGVFSALTAGAYTMVVQDANGCTTSQVVNVVAPTAITAATCTNANDLCQLNAGEVRVEAAGGTGALTASWTSACMPSAGGPLAIPAIFTGLKGNCTYNFVVTDANGCQVP